jgi:hypothetical protein
MSPVILGALWLLVVTGCFVLMEPEENSNERS